MSNILKIAFIKENLLSILISMVGCACVVFCTLYIDTFLLEYAYIIKAVSVVLISILTVLSIIFLKDNKQFVYKLCLITILFLLIVLTSLYVLKITGYLDKFDSVEEFRAFILSFGGYSIFVFILIQFLQVVALPIPAVITVGAGVMLFGAFWGAFYSCVGIIIGSLIAFFIGRIFGVKVVKWLVGKSNLEKGLKIIKGKDRLILTFMFLFPFFPDDLLCFVSGVTSINCRFFLIMIFITRIISVFVSSYSLNNSLIPYDTWWGILLWIVFFILTIIATLLIYKKGNEIENALFNKFRKR